MRNGAGSVAANLRCTLFTLEDHVTLAPRIPKLLAALLLGGVVLGGCATGEKARPSTLLPQQIQTAHDRTGHQNLVEYFDREAITARAAATLHRRMGESYSPAASGRGGLNLRKHCNEMGAKYDTLAADYDRLADYHREVVAGTVR